jgi:hypothetical protein
MHLAVYASSARSSSGMEYIDIHLFEPSTSAKILKSVTLAGPDAEEDLTAREQDWLVSHLKEELGKVALAC